MSVKISVIMAAYNSEKTIAESIDSILDQTFSDWELIICDDGSTDTTFQIIERYAALYPDKIIAIQNERNSKLPYSLNHCLKYARGEYIARMDADDRSYPDRLEKQYNYLISHPEMDVVGSGMTCFDGDRITGERLPPKKPSPDIIGLGVPFFHATIMMKKTVYDVLNGYSLNDYVLRCEDVDLWIRFFAKGFKGANMQAALYYVREDMAASQRRSFQNAANASKTLLYGFRDNGYPAKQYVYVIKPIISVLVPKKIKYAINQRRWRTDKKIMHK